MNGKKSVCRMYCGLITQHDKIVKIVVLSPCPVIIFEFFMLIAHNIRLLWCNLKPSKSEYPLHQGT